MPVELAFADVWAPNLTDVLGTLSGGDKPVIVVPAFLAAGYHVRVDLPAQAAASGVSGRPSVDEAVRMAGRGGRRVAVASWLLAPGLFHRWLGRSGAEVVSEPIGAHDSLVAEQVRRYTEAERATVDRPEYLNLHIP